MSLNRLLLTSAALTLALSPGLAAAQTPATAKTEAQAQAATGKATTDKPAATQSQGTAKAVQQAAPAAQAAARPAAAQEAAAAPAPAAGASVKAQGDLLDTLKLAGQFNTFVKGVDATNLGSLFKQQPNLTVFAPTDAAFAAMPKAELDKLMSDKPALQKFVLRHVVGTRIEAAKIKGSKGPVPSVAAQFIPGEQILLDGSDEAALKVDGATILQADVRASNGILHVVDKILPEGLGGDPTPAADAAAAPTGAAAPTAGTAAKPQQ